MTLALFCGEALCKSPITLAGTGARRWPVRCDACGTSLYPTDVLARLPPNELEPRRAQLMKVRGGARFPAVSADFSAPPPGAGKKANKKGGKKARPPAPKKGGVDATSRAVDRLLGMVDVAPEPDDTPPGPTPTDPAIPAAR